MESDWFKQITDRIAPDHKEDLRDKAEATQFRV